MTNFNLHWRWWHGTLVGVMALSFGCSDSIKTDSRTKDAVDGNALPQSGVDGSTVDVDESSDEPVYVNASSLTLDCKSISADQNQGSYVFGCNVIDAQAHRVRLGAFTTEYQWTVGKNPTNLVYDVVESTVATEPMVTYTFGRNGYAATAAMSELSLALTFTDIQTKTSKILSKRVAAFLNGIANQKGYRYVIDSIQAHDPNQPITFLSKFEVKIDGQWYELVFDPITNQCTAAGLFAATNSTGLSDMGIFRNIFGHESPVLTTDAFPRYSPSAPFDAIMEPLYIEFRFPIPMSLTGFRFNGGVPVASRNFPSGYPDAAHFEVLGADDKWTLVPASVFKVDGETDDEISGFFWKGFDY